MPEVPALWESAPQAIPADHVSITLAHGLGGRPRWSSVVLRCVGAEYGYAVGDEVALYIYDSPGHIHLAFWANVTHVGWRRWGTIRILRRDWASIANITAANWRLVLRAGL